jgi:hypothetical protein
MRKMEIKPGRSLFAVMGDSHLFLEVIIRISALSPLVMGDRHLLVKRLTWSHFHVKVNLC